VVTGPADQPADVHSEARLSYYCCGVRIDAVNLPDSAAQILRAAGERRSLAVHLCNAFTLSLAQDAPDFQSRLNSDDLNLPDGMPLVWIARHLGITSLTGRVYGPDLMLEVLDRGREFGVRHFFYGSSPEVLDRLSHQLMGRLPGLRIAGVEAPPYAALGEEEVELAIKKMHSANADIVWIGLGTPKQDEFVHRWAARIGLPTVAVGAAFDFFAGTQRQAPPVLQNAGLEWIYRLTREPRRLWRRYLFGNVTFLKGLAAEGTILECRLPESSGEDGDGVSVSVLMATYNRRAQTLRCLESLLSGGSHAALRVVVADDASSDGTRDAVRAAHPEVTVVEGSGTEYWAGGMCRAYTRAQDRPFDYLLWLNDDVILQRGAIDRLIETERQLHAVRGPIIVVGALQDPATGQTSYSGVRRRGIKRTSFSRITPGIAPRRAEAMNGNVVLISNAVAERLGGLDPAYRHGIGDYDYGLRAAAVGIETWIASGHVGECSRNDSPEGEVHVRENLRSVLSPKRMPIRGWLTFTKRHAGPLWPIFFASPYARAALQSCRTAAVNLFAFNAGRISGCCWGNLPPPSA